jgi:exonuclease III
MSSTPWSRAGGVMMSLGLLCLGCEGRLPAEEMQGATQHRALSVVTWNMNWLHQQDKQGLTPRDGDDYGALARYARELDADVIVLQEIDGEEAARRIFDPEVYAYHISSRNHVQRVGIVYKRALRVERHPDVVELARVHSERLRYGVDFSVFHGKRELRLLGVHLKSGCFSSPFKGPYTGGEREDACLKLEAQVPVITRWMKRRASERTPFMVVGDFNRRLRPGDAMWEAMIGEVPEAGLSAPMMRRSSQCWEGRYPEFIDHIVMDRRAAHDLRAQDVFQVIYAQEDAERHGYKLSDHCPVGMR